MLYVGDKVRWNTPNGETEGEIIDKISSNAQASSYHLNASENEPKFKVQSSKTGKTALHKASSLIKIES